MKPNRHQIHKVLKKIQFDQNKKNDFIGNEARALVCMAHLTKIPLSKILNITSDDITIVRSHIVIYNEGTTIKLKKKDPLAKIIWDHAKTIGPHYYLFKHFRSERTVINQGKEYHRYDHKCYYWIKKWFGSCFMHVTPRELMKK